MERNTGYEDIEMSEFARRRTYEKTAAAYGLSGCEDIIRQAEEFVRKNDGSPDPIKYGKAEGYKAFLDEIRKK